MFGLFPKLLAIKNSPETILSLLCVCPCTHIFEFLSAEILSVLRIGAAGVIRMFSGTGVVV